MHQKFDGVKHSVVISERGPTSLPRAFGVVAVHERQIYPTFSHLTATDGRSLAKTGAGGQGAKARVLPATVRAREAFGGDSEQV